MRALLVFACAGLVVLSGLSGCSSSDTPKVSAVPTITRTVGAATLSVPESAVPVGVAASSIKMTPLSAAQLQEAGVDPADWAVFSLEPSGLQLRADATLTFALTNSSAVPVIVHLHGDSASTPTTDLLLDPEGDSRATVHLRNFSMVAIGDARMSAVSVHLHTNGGDTVNVGSPVGHIFYMFTYLSNYADEKARVLPGTNLDAKGTMRPLSDVLAPAADTKHPNAAQVPFQPGTQIDPVYVYREEFQEYRCAKAGKGRIGGPVDLAFDVQAAEELDPLVEALWKQQNPEAGAKPPVTWGASTHQTIHMTLYSTAVFCMDPSTRTSTSSSTSRDPNDPNPDHLSCPGAQYQRRDQGGEAVHVWRLKDGECYRASQFSPESPPDECPEVHYHVRVVSLNKVARENSQPCGSTKDSDVLQGALIWLKPGSY